MSFYFKINPIKNPKWITRFYYYIKTKLRFKKPYFSKKLFLEHNQTTKILKEELVNDQAFHRRFDGYPLIQISANYFRLKDTRRSLKIANDFVALKTIVHLQDVKWK
jgi:hypothetical protein